MKKTLGQACDTELILARVEPVRGTKVRLHNLALASWHDYMFGFGAERNAYLGQRGAGQGSQGEAAFFDTERSCVVAVGTAVHHELVVAGCKRAAYG